MKLRGGKGKDGSEGGAAEAPAPAERKPEPPPVIDEAERARMFELIKARHSVYKYTDRPIEPEVRAELDAFIAEVNEREGYRIQAFYDEPECFDSRLAHDFSGVRNYVALVGPNDERLEMHMGYAGQEVVLKAQELGLNTCWVFAGHGKSKTEVPKKHREVAVIALGYGENQGEGHKMKPVEKVSNYEEGMPPWFLDGVEAALLAPASTTDQRFRIELRPDGTVTAYVKFSLHADVDLGIKVCNFEKASGWKVARGVRM